MFQNNLKKQTFFFCVTYRKTALRVPRTIYEANVSVPFDQF